MKESTKRNGRVHKANRNSPVSPELPQDRNRTRRERLVFGSIPGFVLLATFGTLTWAGMAQGQSFSDDFAEFSLEDLLGIEVISPGKRVQRLADVPAAIAVITNEDIRRSGAKSLPEALRLAPGVEVSFISGDRWAVSIRGFSEYLSNKLMVLVDGRSAYSPNFSGVFWNTLQIPLEEIDRIEVIRGPGGSIWGANAVNGVINIITKPASDRQGTSASLAIGNEAGALTSIRHGAQVNDTVFASGYVSGRRSPIRHADFAERGDENFEHLGAGFRLDGQSGTRTWMVAGHGYRVDSPSVADVAFRPPGLNVDNLPPNGTAYFGQVRASTDEFTGANLQAQMRQPLGEVSEIEINASYAHDDLKPGLLATGRQDILDLELQYRTQTNERLGWIMGGGYRHFRDSIQPNGLVTAVSNPDATLNFYSLFAEMEAEVAQDLRLIAGTRFDYNEYTDWEIQPTARLLWNVSPQHTLWTAASQAKRIPSRGERVVTMEGPIGFAGEPPPPALGPPDPRRIPSPLTTILLSSDGFGTETLTAFEIGYRGQPSPIFFLDATAYLHQYRDLRTLSPTIDPPQVIETLRLPVSFTNEAEMSVLGIELSADWRPTRDLRFQATLAASDVTEARFRYADPEVIPSLPQISLNSFAPPERIASLRTSWNVNPSTDFDLWVRHVSERIPGVKPMQRSPASAYLDVRDIPLKSYTTLDARVAWRPAPRTELALIGQNLLDSGRFEFTPLLPRTLSSPVRRGVIGVISHQF